MKVEAMPASVGDYNLTNYDEKLSSLIGKRRRRIFLGMKQGSGIWLMKPLIAMLRLIEKIK